MTLLPGARLGPYEILSAIGAGGMGEEAGAVQDKVVFFFGFGDYLRKIAPVKP